MIQGVLAKVIIKQVMKAIEKADDKKIARSLHDRIEKLEKIAHKAKDFVTCDCCKKKLKEK
jgi:hypothetical protein